VPEVLVERHGHYGWEASGRFVRRGGLAKADHPTA
jgi:hypothetical protein